MRSRNSRTRARMERTAVRFPAQLHTVWSVEPPVRVPASSVGAAGVAPFGASAGTYSRRCLASAIRSLQSPAFGVRVPAACTHSGQGVADSRTAHLEILQLSLTTKPRHVTSPIGTKETVRTPGTHM